MLTVKQRQLGLRTYFYYYTGAIDGIEGAGTKKAYRNFQKNNGLVADGIYGSNTEAQLMLVIRNCQTMLNNRGASLVIDGIVGDATINAIKNFQRANGLGVDGIIGDATFRALTGSPQPQPSHYTCKYFKDSEFACPCCGKNVQKDGIKRIADEIREHFGSPAIITSGTRCAKHNKEVGGVANSWHLYGNAIDIYIPGVSWQTLLAYTRQIVNRGSARYTYGGTSQMGNSIHIDTGGKE